jgi:hypothetical protein
VKEKIQTPRHSKNQCFVLQWKVAELKCNKVGGRDIFGVYGSMEFKETNF